MQYLRVLFNLSMSYFLQVSDEGRGNGSVVPVPLPPLNNTVTLPPEKKLELPQSNNLFAIDIYQEIAKTTSGNLLVSPFSASSALALVQSGAKGETAEELRSALHLTGDVAEIEKKFKELLPGLHRDESYTLHFANKLYVKESFFIRSEFRKVAHDVYGARSEEIDFVENQEAAEIINLWVKRHTHSRIENLVDSGDLNDRTRAILINTLYFRANWSLQFSPARTKKRDFFRAPSDVVQVDNLVHDVERLKYAEDEHLRAQILELPFSDGVASMVVVLPKEADGLQSLEKRLDEVFSDHKLKVTLGNVYLPKFKIEASLNLKGVLEGLGAATVFNETQADLSGISGGKGELFVDAVAQKVFLELNEQGVEAAGATDAFFEKPFVGTPQFYFIADHPFLFYIKIKDLIIFAGRVTDPTLR